MADQPLPPTRSVDPDVATAVHALRMLNALGGSPDQIADALAAAGFTGQTCSGASCPIANYLMQSGLQVHHVTVLGNKIALGFSDEPGNFEVVYVSQAVEHFIYRFDAGHYGHLAVPGPAPRRTLARQTSA